MKSYIVFSILALMMLGCVSSPPVSDNQTNETPAVAEVKCVDSDGLNETVAGNVTIGNQSYADSCDDNNTVKEYYCDGSSLGIRQFACGSGFECAGGACVPKDEGPEPNVTQNCIETDSGQDYGNYGSVNYGGQLYHDVCQGNYDMLEYYCSDDQLKQATHHCEAGERCVSGACIAQEKSCTDSDKNDPLAKGTTMQYGGGVVTDTKYDSCIDNASRTEYYCESDVIKNKTEDCPEDTYCLNGACLGLCSDSDSGKKYMTKGTVTTPDGTSTDFCKDDETLVEYYCSGNSAASSSYSCDGYCIEGRCLSDSEVSCKESGKRAYVYHGSETLLEHNDSCVGYTKVKDYYCDGDKIEYIVSSCDDDEICVGYQCEPLKGDSCYDLDYDDIEGDEHVASMVVLTDNDSVKSTNEDFCLNDMTLVEYSCSGDKSSVEYITCTSDERCKDGACLYPYTCTETDGGKSLTFGAATLWDGEDELRTENDLCTSGGKIFETYCEDGRIKYATLDCPSGMACVDGKCEVSE